MSGTLDVAAVQARLEEFAKEREWSRFHTPKNLAMALTVEAAELLEVFQWSTPEESASPDAAARQSIADEVADVAIYLLRLCDVLEVDLPAAVDAKITSNENRFPPQRATT